MMKQTGKMVAVVAAVLALAGCNKMEKNNDEMKAKVVGVGHEHLILDDGKNTMFIEINEATREHLKGLKKGDKVIVVGSQSKSDPDVTEVREIIKPDGVPVEISN